MFGRKQLLRDFTDIDWDGFAGAESPSPKQPPMIGTCGDNSVVIADANGVEVLLIGTSEDNRTFHLVIDWPLSRVVAEDVVRKQASIPALQALGFVEV